MRELSQTLMGAKIVETCGGDMEVMTLEGRQGWKVTDWRVNAESFGVSEDRF